MSCAWRFPGVDWVCGDSPICPQGGPAGVQVGLAVRDDLSGPWTVTRDGGTRVLDQATPPFGVRVAAGDDGCGHAGALVVVVDDPGFGLHRYALASPQGAYDSGRLLVPGAGSDHLGPGIALGLAMVVAGRLLERVPARWGW